MHKTFKDNFRVLSKSLIECWTTMSPSLVMKSSWWNKEIHHSLARIGTLDISFTPRRLWCRMEWEWSKTRCHPRRARKPTIQLPYGSRRISQTVTGVPIDIRNPCSKQWCRISLPTTHLIMMSDGLSKHDPQPIPSINKQVYWWYGLARLEWGWPMIGDWKSWAHQNFAEGQTIRCKKSLAVRRKNHHSRDNTYHES
jgi:hypothetical protein